MGMGIDNNLSFLQNVSQDTEILLNCLKFLPIFSRGVATGVRGVPHPLASEAVGNFLNFVLLSANLETFCFRKYFVGNILRPIRKSNSLPQRRDIEHPLDANKDCRL